MAKPYTLCTVQTAKKCKAHLYMTKNLHVIQGIYFLPTWERFQRYFMVLQLFHLWKAKQVEQNSGIYGELSGKQHQREWVHG